MISFPLKRGMGSHFHTSPYLSFFQKPINLAIPFLVNDLRQGLACLWRLGAVAQCLLVRIAKGDCSANQSLFWNTQDTFRVRNTFFFEPANARANSIGSRSTP